MSRRVIANSIRAISLAFCLGAALPPIVQAAPITGQSPIDIVTSDAVHTSLPPLQFDYGTDANVTITPIDLGGEDGTIRGAVTPGTGPTDGGKVTVGGVDYVLQQFHFHTPSERLINGQQFPMELHLVNQAADGTMMVVGVMIEEGAPNAARGEEVQLSGGEGLLQVMQEQAPKHPRQHPDRQEEPGSAGDPALPVWRNAAAGNEEMNVWMVQQVLSPRVQHTEEANLRAEMLGIGSDRVQRLRRRAE